MVEIEACRARLGSIRRDETQLNGENTEDFHETSRIKMVKREQPRQIRAQPELLEQAVFAVGECTAAWISQKMTRWIPVVEESLMEW